jgi:hypothetical protein
MSMTKKLTLKEYHAQCLAKRESMKNEQPDKNAIIEKLKNTDIMKIKHEPNNYLSEIQLKLSNSFSIVNNEVVVNDKQSFQKSINDLRFFIFALNILFN